MTLITRDAEQFLSAAQQQTTTKKACCGAVFLVAPAEFKLCEASATDNHYMQVDQVFSQSKALAQHGLLAEKLQNIGVPTMIFPGEKHSPDGIFPNNAYATARGKLILGAMRHPARQVETERSDIRYVFERLMGLEVVSIAGEGRVAELTGVLIVDRARRIGFCGMTERVNDAGCQAMQAAFELDVMFQFDLQDSEYHTNVVMSVLASRACVLHAASLKNPAAAQAIAECYQERVIWLDDQQKNDFAGNCISVTEQDVLISEVGYNSLNTKQLQQFEDFGFKLHAIPASEIEKAGGSIRCMVAEIFTD